MSHRFKAGTYNIYHGTPVAKTELDIEDMLVEGVKLFFLQEASDKRVRQMMSSHNLGVAFYEPQLLIAWDPEIFKALGEPRGIRLSPTGYVGSNGTVRYSEGLIQKLQFRATGHILKCMDYHTPAHVQVRDPAPARLRAAVESAKSWRRIAALDDADADLFAGDDNVSETGAYMDGPLRYFRDRYTGMTQIRAPRPTFGDRYIDDFRIKGKIKAGAGEVMISRATENPSHRIHIRTLILP